jgi:hypothetical protein
MSDDGTVNVIFGAAVDGLLTGTNQARDAITSVGDSVDSISSKFSTLAELIGVTFSVSGIKAFISSMADLGARLGTTGAQLGMTSEQTVEMSGMAKLVGVDVDRLTMGLQRLYLSLQRSTRDGLNPAAQALKVLHLTASDLIGLPADQFFEKLTVQIGKFNPSLNLSTALMQLGAREFSRLVGPLSTLGKHFEEMKAQVAAASEGVAAAQPGLSDTNTKLTLLGISIQSFGVRLFEVLKPAIDESVTAITKWLQSWHQEDFKKYASEIGLAAIEIAQSVAEFFVHADESWQKFISSINSGLPALHTAAGTSLILVGQFSGAIAQFKEAYEGAGVAKPFQDIEKEANNSLSVISDWATKARAFLAKGLSGVGAAAKDPTKGTLLDAGTINENAGQALAGIEQFYQKVIKEADDAYALQKDHLDALVKEHKLSTTAETSELINALAVRQYSVDLYYNQEIAAAKAAGKQIEELEKAKKATDDGILKERQQLVDKAAEEEVTTWTQAADKITTAFNGQLQALLSGTEKKSQAIKKIEADLVLSFIQGQIKATAEYLAQKALELTTSIGTEAGKTAAAATGAAARTAIGVAEGSTSILSVIGGAIKAIYASVAQTDAAVTAEAAPVAGPAAPAVGAATAAASLASALGFLAGGSKSAEIGGYVLDSGLLNVHAGETIVPANITQPYAGPQGGGQNISLNLSSFNPNGLQALIRGMMPQLARELSSYSALNPSVQ